MWVLPSAVTACSVCPDPGYFVLWPVSAPRGLTWLAESARSADGEGVEENWRFIPGFGVGSAQCTVAAVLTGEVAETSKPCAQPQLRPWPRAAKEKALQEHLSCRCHATLGR